MILHRGIFCGFWSLQFALSGCMTVASISTGQIPIQAERRHKIRASDSTPIILGIPFGSTFVNQAREDFMAKCRGGAIEGVLTKFQSTNYPFVAVVEVTMEGYCVKGPKKERV